MEALKPGSSDWLQTGSQAQNKNEAKYNEVEFNKYKVFQGFEGFPIFLWGEIIEVEYLKQV